MKPPRWSAQACICVVIASGGYPGDYEKGKAITGLEAANEAADLALERGLYLTARRDPAAMAALDRFLLDHPRHPRVAEARLAAAHAALESLPPDPAFAKAQLDSASDLVEDRVKLLEERLSSLEGRLESLLNQLEGKLPEQAKDLVKQARDLVARAA